MSFRPSECPPERGETRNDPRSQFLIRPERTLSNDPSAILTITHSSGVQCQPPDETRDKPKFLASKISVMKLTEV